MLLWATELLAKEIRAFNVFGYLTALLDQWLRHSGTSQGGNRGGARRKVSRSTRT